MKKIYKLSNQSGLIKYFATKKLAREWAEEEFFEEAEFDRHDYDLTFEEYWREWYDLEEVDNNH